MTHQGAAGSTWPISGVCARQSSPFSSAPLEAVIHPLAGTSLPRPSQHPPIDRGTTIRNSFRRWLGGNIQGRHVIAMIDGHNVLVAGASALPAAVAQFRRWRLRP